MSGVAGWKPVAPEWAAVDSYIGDALLRDNSALDGALRRSREAGLPDIAVSATQGKLLALLVAVTGARSILEVGTLGGYSTICMAQALPAGGRIVTLEIDPTTADVARANIAAAGLADKVEVRTGAALDLLPDVTGSIDLAFIDADKINNVSYVDHAVRLARPGALIIVDNVVRDGRILDADSDDPSVVGTRALFAHLAGHPRLDATAIQTVGDKGWDGLLLARVLP